MLVGDGYVVTVAHTSSEALELVIANPNAFELVMPLLSVTFSV